MTYAISEDRHRLTIKADDAEREALRKLGDAIHQDATMCDQLEHLTCNSELEWIRPEDTGDLTDAPMLGIMSEPRYLADKEGFEPHHGTVYCGRDEKGETVQLIVERWGWCSYQVTSLLEALRDKGEAALVDQW